MGQTLPLDQTPTSVVIELSAKNQNMYKISEIRLKDAFGALIPYTITFTNRQTEYGGSKFYHPYDGNLNTNVTWRTRNGTYPSVNVGDKIILTPTDPTQVVAATNMYYGPNYDWSDYIEWQVT